MDEALKKRIAIGASVTAHCQPCATYHVEKESGGLLICAN
jgi:AhpD family alkylhydroperoxidase